MTEVYVVMARGAAYDHGPLGVFSTMGDAQARCEFHAAISTPYWTCGGTNYNGDGHHSYVVLLAPIDGGPLVEQCELKAPTKSYSDPLAQYAWGPP